MQAALLYQHFPMVTFLKAAGAKLTVSDTDFGMVLPQLGGFQAAEDHEAVEGMQGPKLTPERIAMVQAR